jgi:hypothetical protein
MTNAPFDYQAQWQRIRNPSRPFPERVASDRRNDHSVGGWKHIGRAKVLVLAPNWMSSFRLERADINKTATLR